MTSAKRLNRKPPKRKPARPRLDDDLLELAGVLDDYALDNNAYGWFRIPWRDGWNAVKLALRADSNPGEIGLWIEEQLQARTRSALVYWGAAEHATTALARTAPFLAASLRCIQICVAKSDGGGEIYNDILKRPFLDSSETASEDHLRLLQALVLEHRCRDSIGTTAVLQNDRNDRQRRAFKIAWSRGLYLAAYALPPAIQ